jgi:hypothetical protein
MVVVDPYSITVLNILGDMLSKYLVDFDIGLPWLLFEV